MNISDILIFLTELSENNHKMWFDEQRPRYEALRKYWLTKVEFLISEISKFDPEIGSLQAKDCVFRINRDVRFSKDKSPYKNNLGAYFSIGGKNSKNAGYYIHLQPNECFLASGIWMPEPPELYKIRQEIDYHFDEFQALVSNINIKNLAFEAEKLASVPKGFDKESPAAEYLKYKSYIFSQKIDFSSDDAKSLLTVIEFFKQLKPFNDFLNRAISA